MGTTSPTKGSGFLSDEADPTPNELVAIEREMPLIEAEVALVDAEIRMLTAEGGPSALDWRRLRRAEARVLREAAALASRPSTFPRRSAA
ncbi:DUF6284 family protein [Planosporangium mesophilum]|uniref:Uncharacterized protein n=1 Tax=Planosporangium mesophilum TaxID=689768 RepID=A0A8J3T868_9ACTN|nr:DUF6284 family protein [Planosporangium mesophilum]NJC81492.1 hypothetical protein [Planosporangium mesophilum]GII20851.1 hypothetical protein Pme01_04480 [Planosporangium mesophilum]